MGCWTTYAATTSTTTDALYLIWIDFLLEVLKQIVEFFIIC
uniref:Uncharacterized protein n=1 Tax=Meloidogyne enterolobii TaxID=390850 RepID=A0A6V7WF05_MELEN|nr:unnamed protein product [Meloidogyne enterolobii]